MTRQATTAPRTPTQAEIARAVGRGSQLRSQAFRAAFAGLFAWIGSFATHQSANGRTA